MRRHRRRRTLGRLDGGGAQRSLVDPLLALPRRRRGNLVADGTRAARRPHLGGALLGCGQRLRRRVPSRPAGAGRSRPSRVVRRAHDQRSPADRAIGRDRSPAGGRATRAVVGPAVGARSPRAVVASDVRARAARPVRRCASRDAGHEAGRRSSLDGPRPIAGRTWAGRPLAAVTAVAAITRAGSLAVTDRTCTARAVAAGAGRPRSITIGPWAARRSADELPAVRHAVDRSTASRPDVRHAVDRPASGRGRRGRSSPSGGRDRRGRSSLPDGLAERAPGADHCGRRGGRSSPTAPGLRAIREAAASGRKPTSAQAQSPGRVDCRVRRGSERPKTANAPTGLPVRAFKKFGGDLLSQGVYPQVPSALAVLTSVFGMGTGVTLPVWPPKSVVKESRDDARLPSTPEQARASEIFRRNQALGRLVPVGSTRCRAYTSGLST